MRTQATPCTPSRRSRGTDAQGGLDLKEQASGAVAVGVDGSRASGAALQWAADQALLTGRPLTVVHAAHTRWSLSVEGPVTRRMTESHVDGPEVLTWARDLLAERSSLVDMRFCAAHEGPRKALLDVSEHAFLVVVGSRGHGSARTRRLGSVGSTLSQHAGCPVVIRRPHADEAGGHGVMVGTDGVRDSEPAVEWAYRQAALRGMPLTLVRTFVDGGPVGEVTPDEPGQEGLWCQLRFVEQQFGRRHPRVPVSLRLERGFPGEALVHAAAHMDTVVVGTHVRRAVLRVLDDDVATTLVESAPCCVTVVPPQLG